MDYSALIVYVSLYGKDVFFVTLLDLHAQGKRPVAKTVVPGETTFVGLGWRGRSRTVLLQEEDQQSAICGEFLLWVYPEFRAFSCTHELAKLSFGFVPAIRRSCVPGTAFIAKYQTTMPTESGPCTDVYNAWGWPRSTELSFPEY